MKAIYLISVILYFVSITLFMSSYEIKKKTRHWVFIFLTLLTLSAMWIITPYWERYQEIPTNTPLRGILG